jgi:hypothetical protein
MTEPPDDWNERERALLAALDAAETPPPELESRVVAALRERGLIRAGRPRAPWRSIAAAIAALAIGIGVGRATARAGRSAATPARTFVLLLYPGAGLDPAPGAEQDRVEEYGLWARGLAAQGRMVLGEKLKDGARLFGSEPPDASPGALQGFFLIRAETLEEAEGIARTCPHRGRGGTIALREVDPT